MVVVDELHGDAATDDLLASAGDIQSFFDQLGLELEVAAGGDGEAAEEELEWLSNKDAFPTVDTMHPEPALMGPRAKVVRRRRRRLRRRGDEELDWLPSKDEFLEVEMAEPKPTVRKVVRRPRPVEQGLDELPNKDAFPAVGTVDPEPAVTKVVRRRRRRQGNEDLDCLPNKDAFPTVADTMEPEPALMGPHTKVVRRRRRRLRRRADEELDWLPKKDAFLEAETAELEPAVTRMALRRRRAGASIAPTVPKPRRQRRCSRCERTKTPHWRAGPEGPRTLCNACGRRYKSERLVPEHRPLSSSTFRPAAQQLRSSMPRRIVEMCRPSSTLVDVVVRFASPTHHLSRSQPRTKEAVCKKSSKPSRGDLQLQASSDQAVLEVASGRGSDEEELELPSNEDALPVLETTTTEVVRQRPRAAELGQRWCQHCGSMKKPQRREEAAEEEVERHCPTNKDDVPAMVKMEPKPSFLVRPRRRAVAGTAAELGQRRCSYCGTMETPQWRRGPEGLMLCNACGLVWYKSSGLVPEYRALSSPTFSPELHSNRRRRIVNMRSAG